MNQLSDKELIKNHTIFHAYFCHLIETDQADSAEELCEIGWKLYEEIRRRKITEVQINETINNAVLSPEDKLMVEKYIFIKSEKLN
jgi:vacuolar-type H+-ATPase subunit B/Vma2